MTLELSGLCPLLQVFDMPTALAFYQGVLGFEIVQQAGSAADCGWCWLRCGAVELMLNTQFESADRPAASDPQRLAAHRDTVLFIGCRDLDGAWKHLQSRGIAAAPPVLREYGMRQLSFCDPDGYGICLQWPAGAALSEP
ncbi:MAG: VOC family protein [Planctomycetes bacterium]|nr:VOC family protein [Planctomycetota bacterium]